MFILYAVFGVCWLMNVIGSLNVPFYYKQNDGAFEDDVSFLTNEVTFLKQTIGKYNVKLQNLITELKQTKKILAKIENKKKYILEEENAGKNVERTSRQVKSQVAFHCQLTKNLSSIANHETIVFDKVKINDGNGYNDSIGVFVVPSSGTYVFSWVTTNRDRSYMNTELTVNGQMFGKAMSDAMDHDDYACATNFGIVTLTAGDSVWIRSGTWHSGSIAGDLYSTFSGWLLF